MRKILGVVLAGLLTATTVFAAVPKEVKIDAAAKKQPAVTFPHEKHATELVKTCDTCHHTNKGLTAANAKDVPKCSSCHLNPAKADTPDMSEMSLKKNPFHMLCMGCHKEQKKGPAKCNECHKK